MPYHINIDAVRGVISLPILDGRDPSPPDLAVACAFASACPPVAPITRRGVEYPRV